MIDMIYDMETQDPDDLFALAIAATHPCVNLYAVTVTPGSKEQIHVVRSILERFMHASLCIPVGSYNPDHPKPCVSKWWYEFLKCGESRSEPDDYGHEIINHFANKFPHLTLTTGAPLKNLRVFLREHPETSISRWVAQGGFAGDNVVSTANRLKKFRGMETCPTFNFNGDPKGAFAALESDKIGSRLLVSKNVCHGLVYDEGMHKEIEDFVHIYPGLKVIYEGMGMYLAKHPEGKKFHDPLAVCCAINRHIVGSREVEVFREKGEWGSRLKTGSNTYISTYCDRASFIRTLKGM